MSLRGGAHHLACHGGPGPSLPAGGPCRPRPPALSSTQARPQTLGGVPPSGLSPTLAFAALRPFPHPRLCSPPASPPPPPLLASGGLSLWGSRGLGPWLSSWRPNAFPGVAKPLLTRLLTRGEGWGPGVSGPFLQAVPAPSSLPLPWGHPVPRLEAPPRCWPASPAGAGGLGSLTASEV